MFGIFEAGAFRAGRGDYTHFFATLPASHYSNRVGVHQFFAFQVAEAGLKVDANAVREVDGLARKLVKRSSAMDPCSDESLRR